MSLETRVDQSANKLAMVEKFMARLGDAREWEFTGDVNDAGPGGNAECICGHKIRYVFMIQKISSTSASDMAHVGSECINNFQSYNPAMYHAMMAAHADLLAKQKADKKARKDAEERAQQDVAHAKWVEIRALARCIAQAAQDYADAWSRGWVGSDTYALWRDVRANKQFKTVKGRIKWLERQTVILQNGIACMEKGNIRFVEAGRADYARLHPATPQEPA